MLPLSNFLIVLDEEQWRFIIGELKQQEAWYLVRSNQILEAIEARERGQYEHLSDKCSELAREISRQIAEQPR